MSATTDLPAAPGARAVARYVRTSASKARRVVNLIRGLPAKEALTVLRFAPQAASVPVYKVLASAIANAEHNEQLDPDSLLVSEAYVNEGPTMRRYRPRAQMRPGPIRKRTCHITIAVEAVAPAPPPAPRRPRKAAAAAAASAAPASTESEAEPAPAGEQPAKKAAKKAGGGAAKATKAAKAGKAAEAAENPTKAAKKQTAKKQAAKKQAEAKAAPEAAAEEETE